MATPERAADTEASNATSVYEPRSQDVARWLREGISEGRLQPGQRIAQEAIASELGVSRIPVREALKQLESEGLVVIKPHSSARVAKLSVSECEEIYKIRERLEPLALGTSMLELTEAQFADAQRLAEELTTLRGNPGAWLAGDRRFHLACYAGVHTPRLLNLIVGFWNTTHPYRRVLLGLFSDRDYDLQHHEHELILDAMHARNVRAGEDLLRTHIERSRLRLLRHRELLED